MRTHGSHLLVHIWRCAYDARTRQRMRKMEGDEIFYNLCVSVAIVSCWALLIFLLLQQNKFSLIFINNDRTFQTSLFCGSGSNPSSSVLLVLIHPQLQIFA
ncbi:hypothetical protein GOODEAATRI_034352 [Goodea atripinnis]|uniref:Uncharacterized protein n=1 Tax=Goodea atripinnis TaxID=208336 RepID=A0ABV0Q3D0_9TELE